jgi:RimJ/RimL family protein N-acetyltransferase
VYVLIADAERVGEFCSKLMGNIQWGVHTAIGIERDGELIGGVVYDGFNGRNIWAHIAGKPGTRWLTRSFLYAMYHYPFVQLGVERITGPVDSTNLEAIRLDTHMGFVHEATLRGASPNGDLLLFVMWKQNCRYLGDRYGREVKGTEGT